MRGLQRVLEWAKAVPTSVEAVPAATRKVWLISILSSVLLVVVVLVGLYSAGIRMSEVKTPSMGTVAPVGTMVVTRPESSYKVGDVVTYLREGRSYTHRIVDQTFQGFITKGDMNTAADALPVTPTQVVGKVVFYGKYLGFLVQGLPAILLGWAVVFAITLLPRVRRSFRWQIRLIGWSLVVSFVAMFLRPWVNLVMLGYVPDDVSGVDMHFVNSGIFPVSVLGKVISSGQDVVVNQTVVDAWGRYSVTPQLALNPGWFLVLLLICVTPMVGSLLIKVEDDVPDAAPVAKTHAEPFMIWGRIVPVGTAVTASLLAVILILQLNTNAAYTASIKNSSNSAGTRTWFSCHNAESSLGASGTYLAWALGTAQGTGTNETDMSGNGRSGRYLAPSTVYSTAVGCNHDTPKAVNFDGATQCLYENANYATTGYTPNTFSLEAWFRTGITTGGVIIGFGASRNTPVESNWDRHIYLDRDGRVVFGVYPGAVQIVYTKAGVSYADNKWHHVIATLSSAGQSLYVDGTLAMTKTAITSAEGVSGYWKVGCGNLQNWRNAATDASGSTALDYSGPSYFTGQIQYAAVYVSALTATQVSEHYTAGLA